MIYWDNPKIAVWSYYYDWAKKYDSYIRHYRHTCQSKHTPLDAIIVVCSNYFLAPIGQFLDFATIAFTERYEGTGVCKFCFYFLNHEIHVRNI
jgi:hypothetical protein